MPIAGIVSGASLILPSESPVREGAPAGRRIAVPGNGDAGVSEPPSRSLGRGLTYDRGLRFVPDRRTGAMLVRVVDNETGEVVRELPPEELRLLLRDRARPLVSERV